MKKHDHEEITPYTWKILELDLTESNTSRGKVITSYGKDGGKASDKGKPITEKMIENGEIPRPSGGFLPKGEKIRDYK